VHHAARQELERSFLVLSPIVLGFPMRVVPTLRAHSPPGEPAPRSEKIGVCIRVLCNPKRQRSARRWRFGLQQMRQLVPVVFSTLRQAGKYNQIKLFSGPSGKIRRAYGYSDTCQGILESQKWLICQAKDRSPSDINAARKGRCTRNIARAWKEERLRIGPVEV
jgi:hypothetical protein